MSSGSQNIGTAGSHRPINNIFSILRSYLLIPTETNTDGEFRLRIVGSYKTPFIFQFIIITIGCRFGTGDAMLCAMNAKCYVVKNQRKNNKGGIRNDN